MKFNSYILGLRDKAIAETLKRRHLLKEILIVKKRMGKNTLGNSIYNNFKDTFIVEDLFGHDEWVNIDAKDRRVLGRALYEECLDNYSDVMMPTDEKNPQKYEYV